MGALVFNAIEVSTCIYDWLKVAKTILSTYLKDGSHHYENMPMQYDAIFKGCKNGNFQMKNCDIFLIFAQNIDYGSTLEPPQ